MNIDKIEKLLPEMQKISLELLNNLSELSSQLMKNSGLTSLQQDFCSTFLVSSFIRYYLFSMEAFGKAVTDNNIYERKKMLKLIYNQILELIEGEDSENIAYELSKIGLGNLQ